MRLNCNESRPLPETASAIKYEFHFSVVDTSLVGKPEEKGETKHCIIKTDISDLLITALWELNQLEIEKVLYEYSKRHITKKLKDKTLKENEELFLTSYNCPNKCPFDPSRIPEPGQRSFEIEIMIKENP